VYVADTGNNRIQVFSPPANNTGNNQVLPLHNSCLRNYKIDIDTQIDEDIIASLLLLLVFVKKRNPSTGIMVAAGITVNIADLKNIPDIKIEISIFAISIILIRLWGIFPVII
jgi:hypothetical protein